MRSSRCRVRRWRQALIVLALAGALAASSLTLAQTPPLTLRIIVVSSADEAALVTARLGNGESFAVLAKELSLDPSANDGGLLGSVDPDTLRPELREALQGMTIGQTTRAVSVPAGVAILKVVEADEITGSSADPTNPGLDAVGSVKYVLGVSGLPEILASLDRYPKAADWNALPQTICDVRRASTAVSLQSLDALVQPGGAGFGMPPDRLMRVHFTFGQLHAYSGRMDEAIDQFEKAYAIVAAGASAAEPAALQLQEALGVAWLHKAAMDNGALHHPGDHCLLSHTGLQPFPRNEASSKAVEHFRRYLTYRPDELEVKWLLNIAYMTLGGYPAQVPPAHLIPPASLASSEDVGRFVDVAAEAGLRSVSLAGAAVVDDFDNDGRFDVVTSSFDSCAPMRFFRRSADEGFIEESERRGLTGQLGGLNAMQADYDNDGCLDLLLLRGGWDRPQRKSLLRNTCTGRFVDVTVASGLDTPITATQAAVWVDIDNDGFLDLFVGNEGDAARLYVNDRDGTFTEIGRAAGVARPAFIKGVAAIDYDNDGWQDLFATSYYLSVEETARGYMKLPLLAPTMRLYRNRGDGTFEDVTTRVGLDRPLMPMGSNFGDIDNDGWLDMYLGTGSPSYGALTPSLLMRNDEGRSFVDVTASAGVGELFKGHGVAFADLDGDGDEEIVFVVGGATQGDRHALRVFENPGHGNRWVEVTLVGSTSNRSAIGTRITVTVANADGTQRAIHRTVGSGGSFGASPLRQHIGLGKAERIVSVETWWPKSGVRQRFTDVPLDKWIEARESATTFTVRDRLPRPTPSAP